MKTADATWRGSAIPLPALFLAALVLIVLLSHWVSCRASWPNEHPERPCTIKIGTDENHQMAGSTQNQNQGNQGDRQGSQPGQGNQKDRDRSQGRQQGGEHSGQKGRSGQDGQHGNRQNQAAVGKTVSDVFDTVICRKASPIIGSPLDGVISRYGRFGFPAPDGSPEIQPSATRTR